MADDFKRPTLLGSLILATILVALYIKLSYTKVRLAKSQSEARSLRNKIAWRQQDRLISGRRTESFWASRRIEARNKRLEELYAKISGLGFSVDDVRKQIDRTKARLGIRI